MAREKEEITLSGQMPHIAGTADRLRTEGKYREALAEVSKLRSYIDAFFDKVMVMAEQKALRQNRLALLADLRKAMNRVADISKLAV